MTHHISKKNRYRWDFGEKGLCGAGSSWLVVQVKKCSATPKDKSKPPIYFSRIDIHVTREELCKECLMLFLLTTEEVHPLFIGKELEDLYEEGNYINDWGAYYEQETD